MICVHRWRGVCVWHLLFLRIYHYYKMDASLYPFDHYKINEQREKSHTKRANRHKQAGCAYSDFSNNFSIEEFFTWFLVIDFMLLANFVQSWNLISNIWKILPNHVKIENIHQHCSKYEKYVLPIYAYLLFAGHCMVLIE